MSEETSKELPEQKPKIEIPEKWKGLKTASDILGTNVDVDEFLEVDSILGKMLLIVAVHEREGQFGKFKTVVVENEEGKKIGFNTGSQVLMKQLDRVEKELPVPCVIEKKKRYYTFV